MATHNNQKYFSDAETGGSHEQLKEQSHEFYHHTVLRESFGKAETLVQG